MSYIQVDVAAFKAHVAALLDAYPELADDDDLRADMIEGETDIVPLVARLVKIRQDASAMASAVKAVKQDYAERQARFERKADGASAIMKSMMIAADLDKLTLPEATVSITKPRVVVEITDLDAIPQGYAKFEKRADKAALKTALEAGEDVPGAALGLSEDGLMVRTK